MPIWHTLPGREAIRKRLSKLWDYERFGVPEKAGKNYFYAHNTGLQNQAVLFVRAGLAGKPRELLDPNTWAKDGATALAEWMPSHDGTKLAYSIQDGGTDWRTIHVLDVATGKTLADEIKWAKFTNIAWARDGSGIFYSRFAEPAEGHTVPGAEREPAAVLPSPRHAAVGGPADLRDARPAAAEPHGRGERRRCLARHLFGAGHRRSLRDHVAGSAPERCAKPFTLIKGLDYNWVLAGSQGDTLYFITNKDAPLQRIVSIDAAHPATAPREIVPQARSTIDSASLVGNVLLVSYLVDAKSEVRRFALDGKPLGTVPLPGIGSVSGFDGEAGDPETFFSFSSFNVPTRNLPL